MPIPFLLTGLGVAAGVIGAGGHLSAQETNEKAQKISNEAQVLYNTSKQSLDDAKKKTETSLEQLGYDKKHVLDTSMKQFLDNYEKIKHIQFKESVGIHELSKFQLDEQGAIQLRELSDSYSSTLASGAAGVAAGAAIALAASGSLGSLSIAGSYLAAGNLGAATSIAGNALSYGAAVTPLAAIVAPVVLFTGISASIEADENLEKARVMYAEAEAASEEMKISELQCEAIAKRSEMFDDLLNELDKMFSDCSGLLAGVLRKKEGVIFKKKLTTNDFTEEEVKLIAVTRSLASAVKSVIDTPILTKNGEITYESGTVYDKAEATLPAFNDNFKDINSFNYNVRRIPAKKSTNAVSNNSTTSINTTTLTVLRASRNILAVVLGIIISSTFAKNIALFITDGSDRFWFTDSYTANHLAVALLLFSSVTILIGKDIGVFINKICRLCTAIALSILYVQFIRTLEKMDHYIIISFVVLFVEMFLYAFISGQLSKLYFSEFFSTMIVMLYLWVFGFYIYAFFTKFLSFSSITFLTGTTVCICFFNMVGMLCDTPGST